MGDVDERGRVACIELEGVLDDAGGARAGAVELVAALRERGWEVVVLTAADPARARGWLAAHGFAETHAQRELTPARVLLSARALRFEGDFAGLLERILALASDGEGRA